MPVYEYKALDGKGKSVKGIVDADNPKGARLKLRGEGLFPTELVEGLHAEEALYKRKSSFQTIFHRIRS